MNIFEKASREKYRFPSRKGNLTVEDLWTLSLESLDRVGQNLILMMKEDVVSLIKNPKSPKRNNETNEDMLEIVKYIISDKQKKGIIKKEVKQKAKFL